MIPGPDLAWIAFMIGGTVLLIAVAVIIGFLMWLGITLARRHRGGPPGDDLEALIEATWEPPDYMPPEWVREQ